MAESVVSFVIERLASAVEQEVALMKNVRKEVICIRFEFESIKARLKDAERQGEMEQGYVVKVWLKEIGRVAFEIEDILDDYVLRRQRRQLHPHGHGTCGFLKNIKFFFKIRCEQHELATQIGDIKIRLENISKTKDRYISVGSSQISTKVTTSDPQRHALFIEDARVVGIDTQRNKITGWLLDQDVRLVVVSIFGMGGLGKTTLVKKVYESATVKEHFPCRLWITVSQTFHSDRLLRDLILQLPNKEETNALSAQLERMGTTQLMEMLRDRLSETKYVVVLDDIWDIGAWKDLKDALPDRRLGSRILVTTRLENIAKACLENSADCSYQLQPLEEDAAWRLFQMVAFKSESNDHSQPDDVSQRFLNKCKGVPLAIVSLAGLLSTKDTSEWEQIYDDPLLLSHHPGLNDVNAILSLSYDDLPHHLKSCLLYLCIFPEDYSIKCSRLLRLWVAEGFADLGIKVSMPVTMTKEDMAKRYLEELIARSLIQVGEIDGIGRVRTCGIHDLLHEFLRTRARDQEFVEFSCQPDIGSYSRRLSIGNTRSGDARENTLPTIENLSSHIRSLFVFGGSSSSFSSSCVIFLMKKVKLLKVLVLEGAHLREDFQVEAVTDLFFLRYLSLRGNRNITSLPDSLEKLINLETLDIKRTRIRELPLGIVKLKCLRHLLSDYGMRVPEGIGPLTTLEKLHGVIGYKGISKELDMLTRLRSLEVSDLDGDEGGNVLATIEKMKFLHSFTLRLKYEESTILDVQRLTCPPPSLQRLRLIGSMDKSPMWILKLANLVKLDLQVSRLKDFTSFFDGLQFQLPKLAVLKLDRAFDGMESLWFKKGGFPRLRHLGLWEHYDLKLIQIEEGAMHVIQEMALADSPLLVEVPMGIEHLTNLKKMSVMDVPTQLSDAMRNHRKNTQTSPFIFTDDGPAFLDTWRRM